MTQDEEVGVLIREAPHTSACRDAAGRLPLALLCSHSSSFDACRYDRVETFFRCRVCGAGVVGGEGGGYGCRV